MAIYNLFRTFANAIPYLYIDMSQTQNKFISLNYQLYTIENGEKQLQEQ